MSLNVIPFRAFANMIPEMIISLLTAWERIVVGEVRQYVAWAPASSGVGIDLLPTIGGIMNMLYALLHLNGGLSEGAFGCAGFR